MKEYHKYMYIIEFLTKKGSLARFQFMYDLMTDQTLILVKRKSLYLSIMKKNIFSLLLLTKLLCEEHRELGPEGTLLRKYTAI